MALISKSQTFDKEILDSLYTIYAMALRSGGTWDVPYWEKKIEYYKNRIQNHDYAEDDAMLQRVWAMGKKWEAVTK